MYNQPPISEPDLVPIRDDSLLPDCVCTVDNAPSLTSWCLSVNELAKTGCEAAVNVH